MRAGSRLVVALGLLLLSHAADQSFGPLVANAIQARANPAIFSLEAALRLAVVATVVLLAGLSLRGAHSAFSAWGLIAAGTYFTILPAFSFVLGLPFLPLVFDVYRFPTQFVLWSSSGILAVGIVDVAGFGRAPTGVVPAQASDRSIELP